ncbi:MAG: TSUP family transporter, partial [Xanthobacteraceae bacterium]
PIVGVVLLFAGVSLLWLREVRPLNAVHDPPIWLGILVGAGIGLLAGLTGTGGGIFLSPIIIFLGWADIRTASGCAAVFILGNSIAGLAGNFAAVQSLPPQLPVYVVAVVLGAIVGTTFGTRLPIVYIQRALGIVLLIAGAKLIGAD